LIVDFYFHSFTPEARAEAINAGAVVTQGVLPRSVVAGNPAQVVREL